MTGDEALGWVMLLTVGVLMLAVGLTLALVLVFR